MCIAVPCSYRIKRGLPGFLLLLIGDDEDGGDIEVLSLMLVRFAVTLAFPVFV